MPGDLRFNNSTLMKWTSYIIASPDKRTEGDQRGGEAQEDKPSEGQSSIDDRSKKTK